MHHSLHNLCHRRFQLGIPLSLLPWNLLVAATAAGSQQQLCRLKLRCQSRVGILCFRRCCRILWTVGRLLGRCQGGPLLPQVLDPSPQHHLA